MVLKSPSRKFLNGVRKLMAELWMNSRSAPPTCFSVSPHLIRAFPVGGGKAVQTQPEVSLKDLKEPVNTLGWLSTRAWSE